MKLTQKQFAEKVGTTSVTISAYENNAKKPSLDIVKDIAEKCNVSLDWLCGLSEKKSPNNEIITYSDVIECLLKINEKKKYFNVELFKKTVCRDGYNEVIQGVSFGNKEINNFLDDWAKLLNADNLFDDELYALWKEKTLKKYGVCLKETDKKDQNDYLPFQ